MARERSDPIRRHLQSWWLYFRADVVGPALDYFESLAPIADRQAAVEIGELGLSRHLVARGCELHSLCAVADVVRHFASFRGRVLSFIEPALRWRARRPRYSRAGDKACLNALLGRPFVCNATLAFGSHLHFQSLLPFLKRQLVRDNPEGDVFVPATPPADPHGNACVDRWLRSTPATGNAMAPDADAATPKQHVVLQAEALARHYTVSLGFAKPKAEVRALDGVSFVLRAGTTLAVVGESGCGKSTLARQLTMIETPSSGRLVLAGVDVATADRAALKTLRRQVQMVFQNPFASLNPRKKIGQALEEPLAINTTLNRADRSARAREMMARVGLRPEHHGRYPHMFSGGQRQRVAIARALMLAPEVVVLDEPVSALDVSIQAQVLNLLMDLQDATRVAYVFISHNLAVVELIADEVLVMYLGKVVERAPKARLFATPRHPYTQALLASTPRIDRAADPQRPVLRGELPSPLKPPSGCAFRQRCPHAIECCRIEVPALDDAGGGQRVACHRWRELTP